MDMGCVRQAKYNIKRGIPGAMGYHGIMLNTAELLLYVMRGGVSGPVEGFTHSHGGYEVYIPHTPTPNMTLRGARFFGEVGEVYVIPPNAPHGLDFDQNALLHTSIIIDEVFLRDACLRAGLDPVALETPFALSVRAARDIDALLYELLRARNGAASSNEAILMRETLLIVTLARDAAQGRASVRPGESYARGIRGVQLYMNANYQRQLTLDALAAMAGYSKQYFITAFREASGLSPGAYLQRLRLSHAKHLLLSTRLPVAEVALRCGYPHASSFSTQFRRRFDMTPLEYRNGAGDGVTPT